MGGVAPEGAEEGSGVVEDGGGGGGLNEEVLTIQVMRTMTMKEGGNRCENIT